MAIAPKPKKQKTQTLETPKIKEGEIQSLIEKGGGIAQSEPKTQRKEITNISLRIPNDITERIAQVITKRPFKTPRHTWILEAILEKLEKEEN